MAKDGRAEAVIEAVSLVYASLFPEVPPWEFLKGLRQRGLHSLLLEVADPRTEGYQGMKYGEALDDFEGRLLEAFKRAYEP